MVTAPAFDSGISRCLINQNMCGTGKTFNKFKAILIERGLLR